MKNPSANSQAGRNRAVIGFIAILWLCSLNQVGRAAPTPLSGTTSGLHFGNSQTENSLPENLPAEFLALGASQAYVEPYLGSGTPLEITIQPQNGKTAQGEIQSRTWSYITMQPGLWNGDMYGQSNLNAAVQIIGWAEAVGQHPDYYVYQAWPFYSPINGWGQSAPSGPWLVVSTYSDLWNRPADSFTTAQFETNGPVFNYLNVYFDIFMDKLRATFPQENISIIPVGEVFAQIDAFLLASNGIPADGPTSLTGAWSFISQNYGDGIHANSLGKYVAHATTLSTITGIKPQNLPIDISAYDGLTADEKSFLDGVIWNVIVSDPRTGVSAKLGVQVYSLPNTADGLVPTQSWDAVGSTPSGDIYVSGMDHVSNAALYRFRPATGTLEYVGDARAASQAANNWLPGEAVQKFHTRPLWYKGKVYVATLNYSNLDTNYLSARAAKWYAYDEAVGSFTDLSAAKPGGTAIDKGGFLALMLSPYEQKFYAMTVPTADLITYDPASNSTTDLGRPSQFNKPYVYSTRFLWADSQGRIYLSAGNPAYAPQTGTPDDTNVFGFVYYYDPGQGFGEHTDWPLVNTTAIQSGQWTLDRKFCYMMDDQANVFVFNDPQRSFTWLGKVPVQAIGTWVFQLSANQKKIYIIEGQHDSAGRLFEFNLDTLQSRVLCSLGDLAPSMPRGDVCGYDSWDGDGRFYITSGSGKTNVAFFQVDPVSIKVAFGFLPSLTQVQILPSSSGPSFFSMVRQGDTNQPCSVVYSARVPYDSTVAKQFFTAVIPAGQTSLDVKFPNLTSGSPAVPQVVTVELIPDGDTYKAGSNRSLTVSFDAIAQQGNICPPTMNLEEPAGNRLANGDSKDWGSVSLGSSTDLSFTLENSGDAVLTGLALWIDGTDASAFAITTNPAPSIAARGTSAFTIRFSPQSAGMHQAVLHLVSNDPLNTLFTINLTGTALAPVMVIEQPAGNGLSNGGGLSDFGAVPVGTAAVRTFTIRNVGNADLNRLNVSISSGQSAFTITSQPASTLAGPSGSTTFTVQFLPISAGPQNATLWINSNDPLNSPFYINLTGTGALPDLVVEQPPGTQLINGGSTGFGSIVVGTSTSVGFTIRNAGAANLTGLTTSIDGASASDFSITTTPTQPVSPGGTTGFTVRFAPSISGSRSANLHIVSNDPSQNPFNLVLNGFGTTGSDLNSTDGPLMPPVAAALLSSLIATIGGYWISRRQSTTSGCER